MDLVKATLELPLNNIVAMFLPLSHTRRSFTYMLQVTPMGMELATLFILMLKRVKERMLPWGTLSSWSFGLERTVPIQPGSHWYSESLGLSPVGI